MTAARARKFDGGTWLSEAPVDLWTLARWAGTAAVVLFFIFPMIFMFMVSLKTQPDIASGGFIPSSGSGRTTRTRGTPSPSARTCATPSSPPRSARW